MVRIQTSVRGNSAKFPENFSPNVPGIDYGVLEELVGYAVRRAQIAIYADFFAAIADSSITPQRFATLVLIDANPGLQQVQLAEILGIARPGATAVIDYWQNRGAVERRTNPEDRRSYGIFITDAGKKLLDVLKKTVRAHDKKIVKGFDKSEVEMLMAMLKKISAMRSAID